MTVELREVSAAGFRFRCRLAGPAEGEPVILLHGFPETSRMWLPVMERLAAEGYRCLAPDQRGYSPGARPRGVEHYTYAHLAGDVLALANVFDMPRFHLVGHDWGAGVGWAVLAIDPDRVASFSALSVPHLAAFGRAIREDEDQRQRSQYIQFFLEEGAAEAALTANDFAALRRIWSAHSPEEIEEYLRTFREPGALTAALNWYRASRGIDPEDEEVRFGLVHTPTLLIWGNRDQAIGRAAVEAAAAYMAGPYRFVELDAGHWLVQEAGERVTEEIRRHLRQNPIPT